jgi:type IV pilus assembly protein PilP
MNRKIGKDIYCNTLPFVPSPQGRGDSLIPSPLGGEGKGEGGWCLPYALLSVIIMLLVLPFAGCKKSPPPATKPMAEKVQTAEVKKDAQQAEQAKKAEPEGYIYDPRGRRDPFLSLVQISQEKPKKKKGASPFESYDVDEIRLLAIASDKDRYYALISLPDKKTYTITQGMNLGLQGGKVQKITQSSVVIREYISDYKGEIKPRDITLKLHKGEEE